jgi:UDP-3-O-[3-hydroxymyristoyl] N-acetylglucosamine deacetylase
MHQTTLSQPFTLSGHGLHNGLPATVTVSPAEENTGYTFTRTDVQNGDFGHLSPTHVVPGPLSTTIRNTHGTTAATIEHCLSALAGMGLTNAHIALNGPEMPILDGSALPFAHAILAAGITQQAATLTPFTLSKPAAQLFLTVSIAFPHPQIGEQRWAGFITPDVYLKEIAPARSFMQEKDVAVARAAGLIKGASMESGVLFGEDGTVKNPEGLRFPDEPVRHKVLDAIGDFALANMPLVSTLELDKPSHASNNALLRELTKTT